MTIPDARSVPGSIPGSRGAAPAPASPRVPAAPVDPRFLDRWSPRAFSPEPIDDATLATLFEAARWAPSCSNEQPWFFLYGSTPEELEHFQPLLEPGNREWADRAPVLAVLFTRRAWKRTGKPNRWAQFDAGASWLALALQARALGLYAHAMGGFDEDLAYELLQVPREDYEAMAVIAIGRYGDPSSLPPRQLAKEFPNGRKPPAEVAHRGRLSA